MALIRALRERGLKTAVVSSSVNCARSSRPPTSPISSTPVSTGWISPASSSQASPPPDTFLAAAARLGVAPARAVVVEDAIAGVQAGRNGRFGLVIGVARHGGDAALRENGADIVVDDLRAIELNGS